MSTTEAPAPDSTPAPAAAPPATQVAAEAATATVDTSVEAHVDTPDAAPAAPDFHSLIKPDGSFSEEFAAALPEELRGIAKTTPDITTALERLRQNQSAARQKTEGMVKLPTADSTPEERAEFFNALGRPETPDGYTALAQPEDLPEGASWDAEFASEFGNVAHQHGLTPDAVAAIAGLYNAQQQKALEFQESARAQLEQEKSDKLQEAFGDKKDTVIAKAKQVAKSIGLDVADGDLFATTENVQALHDFAARFGEDKLVPAAQIDANVDAAERLISITTNPSDPLYASWKSGDPSTVAQVKQLRSRAPADMIARMTGTEVHVNLG